MKHRWNTELYDDKHAYVYAYGEEVLTWLAPKAGEHIVDLGCGTGHLTAKLAALGCTVLGIDSSKEMIEKCKAAYPDLPFEVQDAANFSVSRAFDAVFSNAVLHWVNDPVGAIQSISAALRTGGRFVAEFGGEYNVGNILSSLKESLAKRGIKMVRKNGPWYFPSTAEYAYLLEKNGFLVKRIHHIERPTELADPSYGIRDFLKMFGQSTLAGLSPEEQNEVMMESQERLRETHFKNGKWYADYCRIRLEAWKKSP